MGKPRTFHLAVYAFGLGGAALLTYLVMRQGASQVGAALAQAGLGLVCITAIHPIRVLADTAGWQVLVPRRHRLPWLTALWMHWLGESVRDVLPAARIGGDIVTARLASIHGMPPRIATASAFIGLGAQISFWTVIILETVTQAIRGVTFLVPGALGIQEGGYLVVARIVNISGNTALAAALVRRARELILGIPGAFIWQLIEARHALKTRLNPEEAEPNQPAESRCDFK